MRELFDEYGDLCPEFLKAGFRAFTCQFKDMR